MSRRCGPGPVRAAVAVASAASLALIAGCSTGGTGTRDEGPARTDEVGHAAAPSPTPTAAPVPAKDRIDPVKLVLADTKVSPTVKKGLRPCRTNGYPVDVSYGKLTGPSSSDVLINVMTCNSVGVGSYVFREDKGRWENVFQDEEQPVYATIDRGDLVVTQKVYEQSDSVTYPSSEDVITYRWSASAGRFTEQDRTHNEYSNAVGGDKTAPADN
ncbi:hypothetical protein [Streptomyces sp. TS71-3]|uniref:hypothetical protein n=1 Tax=Streptomyces sp. TS71-3 TaxID=2733862 RepID=UPI001BB43403|nr:hypothetical protein [Streptomyces sp. TS71-3]